MRTNPARPRYYDRAKAAVVYTKDREPSWDEHWTASIDPQSLRAEVLRKRPYSFELRVTRQFRRPEDGLILEGGCGPGRVLAQLVLHGYQCIGVDNSPSAVDFANRYLPELDVRLGDVEALDFPDGYFSGYWSLGVIEHFEEGYQRAAREMYRVLAPGGVLFLVFPYMNALRRLKARLGFYPTVRLAGNPHFYQYALDARAVARDFESIGFRVEKVLSGAFLFGLKDDAPRLAGIVGVARRVAERSRVAHFLYVGSDRVFARLFGGLCAHTRVLVLRKR